MGAAAGSEQVLVEYRRRGGIAGLDQRLTVRTDGTIELDDRRARTRTTALAGERELGRLREALEGIAESRWSRWPRPSLRWLAPGTHDAMRVEVRRGGRRIAPAPGEAEADLAPALAELDGLLSRAVRERRT
jgi:hypothetical protein